MDTRLTLLGLLGTGPGYGYDLKTHWDRWFADTKPLAFGQVYAALARLLRDGLIIQTGAEAGAGPERKRYEITARGRAAVEEWIRSPEVPSDSIQADLFAKTIIALLLDDDAERLLDLQRAAHTARMREITRRKERADLHTILIADHALYHLEADLRWIDLTAARLSELRQEVRA
ncbi:PadR family transcriptional regulator [Actinomyces qiguomingii]|uniref:PadR family transcriptional regulator n=1 Tax=Actinomyces qiguomingii TaxID=2057800 RepID=UPI000CA06483|nr:PadR family transcriptional regulator [Actinomyces qiguomingii]